MLPHVRDVVFPFIKNLSNGEKSRFSEQMKDAVFIIAKPSLLQEAVSIFDRINITARNRDTQGDIYEYLLSQLSTAGKNGQFRTPRHIIRMMVGLIDPNINDRICDPACGTAGFLVNAYEHIIRSYTSPDTLTVDEDGEYHNLVGDHITEATHWEKLWSDTFYGFDFDSTMIRISVMNMMLHGIQSPEIHNMDTLSKWFSEEEKYTVILANPPFKGSIDKSDINDSLSMKTTKTELLFVERMVTLLVTGGRCSVIVPGGVLFRSSNAHKNLRKILLETCQLEGIVSMPSGVFKPYAGVSTAVLTFVKCGNTDRVWFYNMESDGYSLDDKRNRIDGKGDIPDIIERFKSRKNENPTDRKGKCFFVPVDEIITNNYDLSISRYKEIEYEQVEYDPPEKIIDEIETIEKEILKNLDELKGMLNK
ncbi:HsdM family class I SAM-dependent methyltransferase [Methanospirillum purgamenti]|uniref:HsdM family class I SAM-dependent methyltransferase n=1 Tax=Methanospirillum purgamenti TaxID=2834276 RepID=UPI003530132B